jgi:hypothetical protein
MWYGANPNRRGNRKDFAAENAQLVQQLLTQMYPTATKAQLDTAAQAAFESGSWKSDKDAGGGWNEMYRPTDIVREIGAKMGGITPQGQKLLATVDPQMDARQKQIEASGYKWDKAHGSTFVKLRDAVEAAGAVVGNYFLPGSGLVTSRLVSDGAQDHLGSTLGKVAMVASGTAGGINGNLANYGKLADAATGAGNPVIHSGGYGSAADLAADGLGGVDPSGGFEWAGPGIDEFGSNFNATVANNSIPGLQDVTPVAGDPPLGPNGLPRVTVSPGTTTVTPMAPPPEIGLTAEQLAPNVADTIAKATAGVSLTAADTAAIAAAAKAGTLTAAQMANLAKAGVSLAGLVGGTVAATSGDSATPTGTGTSTGLDAITNPLTTYGTKLTTAGGDGFMNALSKVNGPGYEESRRNQGITDATMGFNSGLNDMARAATARGQTLDRFAGQNALGKSKALVAGANLGTADALKTQLGANEAGMKTGASMLGTAGQVKSSADQLALSSLNSQRNYDMAQSQAKGNVIGNVIGTGLDVIKDWDKYSSGVSKIFGSAAEGAIVPGDGPSHVDTQPFMLAPGEAVVTAEGVELPTEATKVIVKNWQKAKGSTKDLLKAISDTGLGLRELAGTPVESSGMKDGVGHAASGWFVGSAALNTLDKKLRQDEEQERYDQRLAKEDARYKDEKAWRETQSEENKRRFDLAEGRDAAREAERKAEKERQRVAAEQIAGLQVFENSAATPEAQKEILAMSKSTDPAVQAAYAQHYAPQAIKDKTYSAVMDGYGAPAGLQIMRQDKQDANTEKRLDRQEKVVDAQLKNSAAHLSIAQDNANFTKSERERAAAGRDAFAQSMNKTALQLGLGELDSSEYQLIKNTGQIPQRLKTAMDKGKYSYEAIKGADGTQVIAVFKDGKLVSKIGADTPVGEAAPGEKAYNPKTGKFE